jgi:hypothetical protein
MQLFGLKGILFPNYRPENYDFNTTKSIFFENMAIIHQIFKKEKEYEISKFLQQLHQVGS